MLALPIFLERKSRSYNQMKIGTLGGKVSDSDVIIVGLRTVRITGTAVQLTGSIRAVPQVIRTV